ncbi:tripartite motif-containing protein 75-like [Erinaceus europaeus]|uniref:Tripartite motif-containing protein 75-like n=1 Tax=Erinaceus europaeus TaxID=9365 RepID=A0A1S3A405_ERIEU|nr:tripartite motif-containing protein 75-like [Erinaceus europaeus]
MVEDSRCAICLDFMRESATTECGHNFCQSCLQKAWEDSQDIFHCPLCWHPFRERHWTVNSKLARMIDVIQLLHSSKTEMRQKEPQLCERHNQELSLFCVEDKEVLCLACVELPDHQDHHVKSTEEATSHYRQMINDFIGFLMKHIEGIQKCETRQNKKLQELRMQVRKHRWKLATEFWRKIEFVDRAEEAALSRQAEEERSIQQSLSTNIIAFQNHICTMDALLKEVAEKSVMPQLKMLSEAGMIHQRYTRLDPPALYSFQLRKEKFSLPPLDSTLGKIVQKFRTELTLDPHTAHSHMYISKDKHSVRVRKKMGAVFQRQPRFLFNLVVLSTKDFHCGRHYWEVPVNDKPRWAIGLCSHFPSSRGQQKQPLSVLNRRWTIQLQHGDYVAQGACPVPLALKEQLRGIGIYLDYEVG